MKTQKISFIVTILVTLFSIQAHSQTIKSLTRASLSPTSNQEGESYSYDPSLDGNGRLVAFTSTADNFAADGAVLGAAHEHVYLRDTLLGTTTQLDVTTSGQTGSPGASFDTGIRTFKSSLHPHLSRDGKYVVFTNSASNISPDGANETFGNWTYIKNLDTGDIQRIPFATASDSTKSEFPTYLAINADGSVVVISSIIGDISDTTGQNSSWEISVYNRNSNTTTLLSTGLNGNKFNPGISDDGRFIVFEHQVGDFSAPTYSYLYDLTLSELTALNSGNKAQSPAISGDGNFIAYADHSSEYIPIKILNRISGAENTITNGYDGTPPTNISEFPSLSIDGRYIAFLSAADNLVQNDSNELDDIFVYDQSTGKTTLVSVQGACPDVQSKEQFNTGPPSISSDGSKIAFTVLERLVPADQKDSSGNITEPADTKKFDDVYVAEIDYNNTPDIFKNKFTPTAPFVTVNCIGDEANIQVESITTLVSNSKSKAQIKASKNIKKITRQVIIKKTNSNGKKETYKKYTAKRNELSTKNLPPGNYTAQVQADAKLKNGKTQRSKLSPAVNFKITK
jgi:Tol biopolymer transport system component